MTVERAVAAEDQIKERRKLRNLRHILFLVLVKKAQFLENLHNQKACGSIFSFLSSLRTYA